MPPYPCPSFYRNTKDTVIDTKKFAGTASAGITMVKPGAGTGTGAAPVVKPGVGVCTKKNEAFTNPAPKTFGGSGVKSGFYCISLLSLSALLPSRPFLLPLCHSSFLVLCKSDIIQVRLGRFGGNTRIRVVYKFVCVVNTYYYLRLHRYISFSQQVTLYMKYHRICDHLHLTALLTPLL